MECPAEIAHMTLGWWYCALAEGHDGPHDATPEGGPMWADDDPAALPSKEEKP